MAVPNRTAFISYRLTRAEPTRVNLSERELQAVLGAAKGLPASTFVRWLVEAGVSWREGNPESPSDLVAARASELGLTPSAYARQLVLEAVGHTDFGADVARARKVARS